MRAPSPTYTQAGAQDRDAPAVDFASAAARYVFRAGMVARLGIATGQGFAAIIYQRFGKRWGRFSLADLLLVNFLTLVTEFAAVVLAARHLGLPPALVVPLAAASLVLLVGTGSYRRWERMTLALCGLSLGGCFSPGMSGRTRARWSATASFLPCPRAASPVISCSWSSPSPARRSRPGSCSSSRAVSPTSGCGSPTCARPGSIR